MRLGEYPKAFSSAQEKDYLYLLPKGLCLERETVITILLLHSRRTKKGGKKEDFIWKNKTFEISPASHFLFLGMQEFQLILYVPNSFDTVLMIALFPPPQVQLLLQVALLSVAGHLTTASAQAAVRNLVGGATAAKNNSIFFFLENSA